MPRRAPAALPCGLPAFCLLSCLLVLAVGPLTSCGQGDEAPNIVLIVGDDVGYRDYGFMGSPHVRTPNLDRLARAGTVFTNAHTTASICKPSLRSLLTGLHPNQWRFRLRQLRRGGIQREGVDAIQDFATLPRQLGGRGYASLQGGKYWERRFEMAGFTHGIQEPGDDTAWVGLGEDRNAEIGRATMEPIYRFIDAQRDGPFFVWFAPKLPHLPHDAPRVYLEQYADQDLSSQARAYFASITRFDDIVGQLIRHLETSGLSERTLVVYLADNGWDQAADAVPPVRNVVGDPGDGYRGKKSMHELGFRTPLIFAGPGVPAGQVRGDLVSTVDLFPTLLGYAGARVPADRPGRDLRPVIQGQRAEPRGDVIAGMAFVRESNNRPRTRAGETTPARAAAYFLRTDSWRYIWRVDADFDELYDIRSDPDEGENVAPLHPELTRRFRSRIEQWRRDMRRPFEG